MTTYFWAGFEKAAEEKKKAPLTAKSVGALTGAAVTGGLATHESIHNLIVDELENKSMKPTKNFNTFQNKLKPGDIVFSRLPLSKLEPVHPALPVKSEEAIALLHGSPFQHAVIYRGKGDMYEASGVGNVRKKNMKSELDECELKAYRQTRATKKEIREALDFAHKARGAKYKSPMQVAKYTVGRLTGLGPSSETAAKNIHEMGATCTGLVAEAFPRHFKKDYMGFNEIRNTKGMKLIARYGNPKKILPREHFTIRVLSPLLNNLKAGVGAGVVAAAGYKGWQKYKEHQKEK